MALAPVLSTILAALFLHENLASIKLVGIAITIVGIMVVIADRAGGGADQAPADRRRYIIGLLCGLGGAAGQAGGSVLSKIGLANDFPPLSGNVIRLLAAFLLIWIIAIANRQLISSFQTLNTNRRALLLLTGGAILGPVLGVWLSLVSLQITDVGVSSTLSSLMPIFLIPISYVVFKERVTKQAIVGTLIAFVGMVTLFL
jgi:drug/metabolite transporter (DMT)-like permease